jgi:hypothetical protein
MSLKIVCAEQEYEVYNGMIGFNRDVLMKLIKIIGMDFAFEKKIRSIIGTGQETLEWSKHKIWIWARRNKHCL